MATDIPTETMEKIETNVTKILNLDMGTNAINDVIMPVFTILHKINPGASIESLKTSIGKKIEAHVGQIAQRVSDVRDSLDFLQVYATEWSRFKVSCVCFDAALKKLFQEKPPATPSSSSQQASQKKPEQTQIRSFCYSKWSDYLLTPLKTRIQPAIFELLGQQRAGSMAEFQNVRHAIDSYREIDVKQVLYLSEFEQPFLEHTREYYHSAAAKSLSMDGPAGYLDFCDRVLQLEDRIATQYLAPSSYQAHKDRVNQAIILDHLETIQDVLGTIFDKTNNVSSGDSAGSSADLYLTNLRRIYVMFDRIDKVDDLLKIFETQVDRVMQKRFEDLVPQAGSKDREVLKNFPLSYCQGFLIEYHQFMNTIDVCFNSSARFVSVLDKAAKTVLNNNAIHKPGDSREPSPTLAARYADILLTDKTIDIAELKANRLMLPGIKLICSLLISKDYFQAQYKKLFSVRLLSNTKSSNDAEVFLIQLFRTVLNVSYSQELLVMIRDMEIWQRNRPGYFNPFVQTEMPAIKYGASAGPQSFEPLILTAQSWPLDTWDKNTTMKLPDGLREISEAFCAHYSKFNDGKEITWMHERSTAQIDYEVGGKRYGITGNHFQIAALCALAAKPLMFEELYRECELQQEWLEAALNSILRSGLAQQNPKTKQNRLNPKFAFAQRVLSIATSVWVRPVLPNPDDVGQEIEDQRNANTQAAIVRIMKARRVLHHTELLDAVQQQTSRYFPQTADRIKKQIDKLMQGTDIMLAREENDRNTYRYVTGQDA